MIFVKPVVGNPPITQTFVEHLDAKEKYGWQNYNGGIDYGIPTGSKIFSTCDGIVSYVGTDTSPSGGYGNYVKVQHNNDYLSLYAHLKKSVVNVGQKVIGGQQVAISNNTGMSTGSHVHFEVRKNNIPVDPQPLLDASEVIVDDTNPEPADDVNDDLATGNNAVVISSAGANLRDKSMTLLGLIYQNTEVKITGEPVSFVDGIKRYPVVINGYLAQDDGQGNTILQKTT
jgi:hypothetical protein